MLKTNALNPFILVVSAFLLTMFFGAILLMQPWASQVQNQTSFIDALFTSASALFVTGLAVLETGSHYSFAGQLVILALIQIGALGVVTIGGYLVYLFGQRFYYKDRQLLGDSLGISDKGEVISILRRVVRYVFILELIGAVLLCVNFLLHSYNFADALWFGVFHSISAFANAGFDVFGQGNSAASLLEVGIALEIVMLLIIIGGLGFPVWMDLRQKSANPSHRLSLHSKVVLLINAILLIVGALVFYLFESQVRLAEFGFLQHFRESLFHSVSSRTAGFSAFDLSEMSKPSLVFMMILMFIGGAPASTAGGIKVTAALIIFLLTWSLVNGSLSLNFMRRRIPTDLILRSVSVAVISLLLVVVVTIALEFFDDPPFLHAIFESFSAMGTVGLSLGLTPTLSVLGKIMLIISMFMGRVGLYALLYGVIFYSKRHRIIRNYPKANLCL
jgi:trk system potassium uptake protein TrkH